MLVPFKEEKGLWITKVRSPPMAWHSYQI